MSRNGSKQLRKSPAPCFVGFVALFAAAKSVFVGQDVLRRVLMPLWAMCFCFLSSSVCFAAKCKTRLVNPSFLAGQVNKRHVLFRSLNDSVCFQPVLFGERPSQILHAIGNYLSAVAPVKLLLCFRRPFAIVGRVRSIIVNSVKTVFRWARSHVAYKIQKSCFWFKPALADKYPAPAVVLIKFCGWHVTAPFHSGPNRAELVGW